MRLLSGLCSVGLSVVLTATGIALMSPTAAQANVIISDTRCTLPDADISKAIQEYTDAYKAWSSRIAEILATSSSTSTTDSSSKLSSALLFLRQNIGYGLSQDQVVDDISGTASIAGKRIQEEYASAGSVVTSAITKKANKLGIPAIQLYTLLNHSAIPYPSNGYNDTITPQRVATIAEALTADDLLLARNFVKIDLISTGFAMGCAQAFGYTQDYTDMNNVIQTYYGMQWDTATNRFLDASTAASSTPKAGSSSGSSMTKIFGSSS